jgi:hypothetical protein
MSEPIERLSRFTPDASGIDRDSLLFAAGRASAHPSQRWHAVCAALVTTQLLTLGLALLPRPVQVQVVPGRTLPPMVVVDLPTTVAPPPSGAASLLVQRERAIASGGDLPAPPPMLNDPTSEPPLHAFGAMPAYLQN